MHDCQPLLNQLSLDLDNQLSAAEGQTLRAEIERHPECWPLVRAMQQADRAFRSAPLLMPRHDLAAAIVQQIEQQRLRDRRLLGMTFLVGGTLSLWPVALAGLLFLLAVVTAANPFILKGGVELLVALLRAAHALFFTLGALNAVLWPWLLPALSATLGLLLLVLTVIWAARVAYAPRYAEF